MDVSDIFYFSSVSEVGNGRKSPRRKGRGLKRPPREGGEVCGDKFKPNFPGSGPKNGGFGERGGF